VDKTAWRRDKEEEEEEEEEDSSSDDALHLMEDVFLVRLTEDWTCARKSRMMETMRERDNVSATKKGRAQRAIVHQKKRETSVLFFVLIKRHSIQEKKRRKISKKKSKNRARFSPQANYSRPKKELLRVSLSLTHTHLLTTNDGDAVLNASGRSKHYISFLYVMYVYSCVDKSIKRALALLKKSMKFFSKKKVAREILFSKSTHTRDRTATTTTREKSETQRYTLTRARKERASFLFLFVSPNETVSSRARKLFFSLLSLI